MLRFTLLAMLLLPVLAVGCTTPDTGTGPQEQGLPLLVQPLRSIGLIGHHVNIALGRHRRSVATAATVTPDAQTNLVRACSGGRASVTWLGHSSALIYIGGRCILTDPVLEVATSALSPLPPKLMNDPLRVADLPAIDTIILSHGDYDHLHLPTMHALLRRIPNAEVLVPPGVRMPVIFAGYPRVARLSLGETRQIRGVGFTAAPAHHEIRRNPAALKSGEAFSWIVTDGRTKVLFIGDTGYGPSFSAIGKIHGPFDLLLVPIGAYEPRELVGNMHATPEQAAQISSEVDAKIAIGIHWGTFALSPDRPEDTVRRFIAAGRDLEIRTRVLRIGDTQLIP